MLYGITRLVFWSIIFILCCWLLEKVKIVHKRRIYLISSCLIIVLCSFSFSIPVENLFITFSSPEAAFRYMDTGIVELVVEGQETTMVIAQNGDADIWTVLPKSDNGWKLGVGKNLKTVVEKVSSDIVIYVSQYRNTEEYYIRVLNTNGGELKISDNQNSTFQCLIRFNELVNKTFSKYYSCIHNFDETYVLTVDGNPISLIN